MKNNCDCHRNDTVPDMPGLLNPIIGFYSKSREFWDISIEPKLLSVGCASEVFEVIKKSPLEEYDVLLASEYFHLCQISSSVVFKFFELRGDVVRNFKELVSDFYDNPCLDDILAMHGV